MHTYIIHVGKKEIKRLTGPDYKTRTAAIDHATSTAIALKRIVKVTSLNSGVMWIIKPEGKIITLPPKPPSGSQST